MKIAISYPPITNTNKRPTLSQSRQFQFFQKDSPTYIFPVVPASTATMVNKAGHEVIWNDGIAEERLFVEWLVDLVNQSPDVVMMETKTPVIKQHWHIINQIKKALPKTKVVLVGDHVTALPNESLKNSKVDYVIAGGNYDFALTDLVNKLETGKKVKRGVIKAKDKIDLNKAPFIDRDLTQWKLYAYKNGNFVRTPATYVMAGRDCWHHRCTFCSWATFYPKYCVRSPENVVVEIMDLIYRYRVKEIFDDTGTFPIGKWLTKFCKLMIGNKFNEKIYFSCNMRFGALRPKDYKLMKKAGCRMLLFGLESANQYTLDKLDKGIKVQDIINGCKWAREAGLDPHMTLMFGYKWETEKMARKTLELAKMLMEKGWARSLQATIVIPYPSSLMYKEAKKNNWFAIDPMNYGKFDMSQPVLKTEYDPEEFCNEAFKIFLSRKVIMKRLLSIRSYDDVKFIFRGMKKLTGHLKDFGG